MLVPGSGTEELSELGERLRRVVCELPLAIGNDRVLKVTLSAGCRVGPIEALEEAIRVADEALYQAKQTGRNQLMTKSMIA